MAKDDDLFSWNRPKPRDAAAGAFKTQAAHTIQNELQSSGSFRTDVRLVGATTVKTHTNQGMPWVETFTPSSQQLFPACPKSDYGFADYFYGTGEAYFLGDDPPMGDGPIRKLVDATGERLYSKRIKNNAESKVPLLASMPSMFTGQMRKVMQVMHGAGPVAMGASGVIYYNKETGELSPRIFATWSLTYGLFIGTSSSGSPTRWLIKITPSGIWRYPIQFCKKLPEDWESQHNDLPSDDGAAHAAFSKYWTVTKISWASGEQIADSTVMAEYAQCWGLTETLGWAFNKHGTQAVNTGVSLDPTDPTERRQMSALFTITISQDADGKPISATCTQSGKDLMMAPFRDDLEGNHNAVFQVAGVQGLMTTYSCWPGFGNYGTAYGRKTNTPVMAYFDLNDALDVVYYTFDYTQSSGTDVTGNGGVPEIYYIEYSLFGTTTTARRMTVPDDWSTKNKTYLPTAIFSSRVYSGGEQSWNSTNTGGYFTLDGGTGYIAHSLSGVDYGVGHAGYHRYMTTNCGAYEGTGATTYDGFWGLDYVQVMAQTYSKSTYTESETHFNMDVLLIPGYDRTAYLHYRAGDYGRSGRIRNVADGGISKGVSSVPEYDRNSGGGYDWPTAIMTPGAFNETVLVSHPCEAGNPTYSETWIHDQSYYAPPQEGAFLRSVGGVTTQTGIADPDESTITHQMGAVLNGSAIPVTLVDVDLPKRVTFEASTKYYSCFSGFRPTRYAYDTKFGGPSTVAGFSYPTIESRNLAFIGVF